MLAFLQVDDATSFDGVAIPNPQAGQDSGELEFHLWNEQGNPLGQPEEDVLLVMQTRGQTSQVFVSTGVPPQDELWGRLRILGFNNQGDPSWTLPTTDPIPLGAFSALAIPRIPPDCAVHLGFRIHPPASAGVASWVYAFSAISSEAARAVPAALTQVERGVITHAGDPGHSGLLRGGLVSVSVPADDRVHVAPALWQHRGRPVGKISTSHAFDLTDGAAVALVDGESYWAVLSLSAAGVTVTKGLKGAAPDRPALPEGEVPLVYVQVLHEGGAAPVIEAADLDGELLYDRLYFEHLGGTDARIHPGQALAGGSWRMWSQVNDLQLVDDADNWIWQLASGAFDVTQTEDPPETTALALWRVTLAAGVATLLEDLRLYAGRGRVLRFAGPTPAVGEALGEISIEGARELHWEETVLRPSGAAAGASGGQTQVDVLVNGATAFPSFAVEDLRPAVPFDSAEADRSAIPELPVLRRGDVVQAVVAELPVGGVPTELELQLITREA